MARVICLMFFELWMRRRMSRWLATRGLPGARVPRGGQNVVRPAAGRGELTTQMTIVPRGGPASDGTSRRGGRPDTRALVVPRHGTTTGGEAEERGHLRVERLAEGVDGAVERLPELVRERVRLPDLLEDLGVLG